MTNDYQPQTKKYECMRENIRFWRAMLLRCRMISDLMSGNEKKEICVVGGNSGSAKFLCAMVLRSSFDLISIHLYGAFVLEKSK